VVAFAVALRDADALRAQWTQLAASGRRPSKQRVAGVCDDVGRRLASVWRSGAEVGGDRHGR
jgi:hypothetical protein